MNFIMIETGKQALAGIEATNAALAVCCDMSKLIFISSAKVAFF